jgi:predicted amidohydrolase
MILLTQPQLRAMDTAGNLDRLRRLLCDNVPESENDIAVLPEHWCFTPGHEEYAESVIDLAAESGWTVIGGSHHERDAAGFVNSGCVARPDGEIAGWYQKVRPYSDERRMVHGGVPGGCLNIGGRRVAIMICADFWYTGLLAAMPDRPDLVLVPALSVTRKDSPDYSRALWRHTAVARAYEFGVIVGISDWGHPSELPRTMSCGVGGLADPSIVDPELLFKPMGSSTSAIFMPDFNALDAFREDKRQRGFAV